MYARESYYFLPKKNKDGGVYEPTALASLATCLHSQVKKSEKKKYIYIYIYICNTIHTFVFKEGSAITYNSFLTYALKRRSKSSVGFLRRGENRKIRGKKPLRAEKRTN